jgi:hypothetical protein
MVILKPKSRARRLVEADVTKDEGKMKLGKKFKDGYLVEKKSAKTKSSGKELQAGLKTLQGLWKKGFMPNDLRKHIFLTWFVFANGNVVRQSKITGWHRNSIIVLFQKERIGSKTFKFRNLWKKIKAKNQKRSFDSLFYLFYKKAVKTPSLTPSESKALVNLWLMGFPLKALRTHYVFCALEDGLTWERIARKLDVHPRTLSRIRFVASKRGSLAATWLYPLKSHLGV